MLTKSSYLLIIFSILFASGFPFYNVGLPARAHVSNNLGLHIDSPADGSTVSTASFNLSGGGGGIPGSTICDEEAIPKLHFRDPRPLEVSEYELRNSGGSLIDSGSLNLTLVQAGITDSFCGAGDWQRWLYSYSIPFDACALTPGSYTFTATAESGDPPLRSFFEDSKSFQVPNSISGCGLPPPGITTTMVTAAKTYGGPTNPNIEFSYWAQNVGDSGSLMNCDREIGADDWITFSNQFICSSVSSGELVPNTVVINATSTNFGTNTGSIIHKCEDFNNPSNTCDPASATVQVEFTIDLSVDLQGQPL